MRSRCLIFFLFCSFPTLASQDSLENPTLYQEILERHVKEGHILKADVEKQRFYFEKEKQWRGTINNQMRGIASSLKTPKDVIELDNPTIEIPVD